MGVSTRIDAARTALRHARSQRAAHRRLTAELAAFVTPAERAELDLILGRHSMQDTRQVRAILNHQDAVRQQQTFILGHHRGR